MRAVSLMVCGFATCVTATQDAWPQDLTWNGLSPIQHSAGSCSANVWSSSTALTEVQPDLSTFLSSYDAAESSALAQISAYATHPWNEIKTVMELALAAASLYELPGLSNSNKAQITTRVRRIADAVLAVRNDKIVNNPSQRTFMWVEQRTMRGWPHYIKDLPTTQASINHQATCIPVQAFLNNWNDAVAQNLCRQNCAFDHNYPYIDAYQNGHILQVLALAALLSARAGDHAAAGQYVAGVAEAMYDRYFASREASLLDTSNRVVNVPSDASADRRRRWVLMTCQFTCHDLPAAHNHGIVVAAAAFYLREAIALVDWSVAAWPLSQMSQANFRASLKSMVQGSVSLLLGDMATTATGARRWKYRANVLTCPELGTTKDRWEDITHARYEVDFLAMLFDQNPSNEYGITEALVEGVLRTYLEGLVHPQSNPTQYFDGRRFACDLSGVTDVDASGQTLPDNQQTAEQKKSCKDSRRASSRVTFASQWSYLAAALPNPSQRCNSLKVASSTFPMLFQASPYFGNGITSNNAGKQAQAAAAAVWAKFWFYNYATGLSCCTTNSLAGAGALSPAPPPAGSSVCRNKMSDSKCKKKKSKGKCSKNRIKRKCKLTCGACSAG